MKRAERRTAEILLIIATAMIIVMAVGAVMAHAATRTLGYGQCVTVGRNRYCAPAKNVCPTPKPCPTSTPCPQPTPCPALTNDGYWYAIASLFLACGSEGTGWNLPANSYVAKLMGLSFGKPMQEITTQGCYLRYWDNALVILNPQDSSSCTIPLEGAYKDVDTGATVSGNITVKPKQGKVLVR